MSYTSISNKPGYQHFGDLARKCVSILINLSVSLVSKSLHSACYLWVHTMFNPISLTYMFCVSAKEVQFLSGVLKLSFSITNISCKSSPVSCKNIVSSAMYSDFKPWTLAKLYFLIYLAIQSHLNIAKGYIKGEKPL